jgi:DNA invertase Pin-like site-specific DNA recombinase
MTTNSLAKPSAAYRPAYHLSSEEDGIASDFIEPANTQSSGTKAILVLRVSTSQQKASLKQQCNRLKEHCTGADITVIAIKFYTGNGNSEAWLQKLETWSKLARDQNAVLFAESTDRFLRGPDYHTWPSKSEFKRLKRATDGVQLVTLLRPDDRGVRSAQTARGMKATDKPLGRRPKTQAVDMKRRRRANALKAYKYYNNVEQSYRKTGELFGVDHMTAKRWILYVQKWIDA